VVALTAAIVLVAGGIVVALAGGSDDTTEPLAVSEPVGYGPQFVEKACSDDVRARAPPGPLRSRR
jgi:hypothetical protein